MTAPRRPGLGSQSERGAARLPGDRGGPIRDVRAHVIAGEPMAAAGHMTLRGLSPLGPPVGRPSCRRRRDGRRHGLGSSGLRPVARPFSPPGGSGRSTPTGIIGSFGRSCSGPGSSGRTPEGPAGSGSSCGRWARSGMPTSWPKSSGRGSRGSGRVDRVADTGTPRRSWSKRPPPDVPDWPGSCARIPGRCDGVPLVACPSRYGRGRSERRGMPSCGGSLGPTAARSVDQALADCTKCASGSGNSASSGSGPRRRIPSASPDTGPCCTASCAGSGGSTTGPPSSDGSGAPARVPGPR